jgi:hypothetical protein
MTSAKQAQAQYVKHATVFPQQILASYDAYGVDMLRIVTSEKSANQVQYHQIHLRTSTDTWVQPHLQLTNVKIYGVKPPNTRNSMCPTYSFPLSHVKAFDVFDASVRAQLSKSFGTDSVYHSPIQRFRTDDATGKQILEDPLVRIKLKSQSATNQSMRGKITIVSQDRSRKAITACESDVHTYVKANSTIVDQINLATLIKSVQGYSLSCESSDLYIRLGKPSYETAPECIDTLFTDDDDNNEQEEDLPVY